MVQQGSRCAPEHATQAARQGNACLRSNSGQSLQHGVRCVRLTASIRRVGKGELSAIALQRWIALAADLVTAQVVSGRDSPLLAASKAFPEACARIAMKR